MNIEVHIKDREGKFAKDKEGKVMQPISVSLAPDTSLDYLRRELGTYIGFNPAQLKFVCNVISLSLSRFLPAFRSASSTLFLFSLFQNRVLYPEEYDQMTIRQARIRPFYDTPQQPPQLIVYQLTAPEEYALTVNDKPDHLYPRYVLSNLPEYFEQFFEMLKIGGDVGQRVWNLIASLPRNKNLAKAITTLSARKDDGSVDWPALLDSSSLLKLNYALGFVDSHIKVNDDDSEQYKKEVRLLVCSTLLLVSSLFPSFPLSSPSSLDRCLV
jgi:hypothetical protein